MLWGCDGARTMRLRLWRRFRIVPGIRANLSRSGVSLSVGRRGAWYTTGPRGRRVTAGWPGTGLFWTERLPPAAPPHGRHLAVILLWLAALVAAVIMR
jgi:Protein of unknown function (DUF4236)